MDWTQELSQRKYSFEQLNIGTVFEYDNFELSKLLVTRYAVVYTIRTHISQLRKKSLKVWKFARKISQSLGYLF